MDAPRHPHLDVSGTFAGLRLGRTPKRDDPRTLQLANYVDLSALPPIPPSCDWTAKVAKWPMYGNDQLGDCTCAAAGHMVQAWSSSAGHAKTPSTTAVERAYWETGSPPSAHGAPNGPTDSGRNELDVLNYWRRSGIGGDHITAYASVHPTNHALVKAAIYLFGGVYTGVGLPLTAQGQHVWDVVGDGQTGDSAPWSWGGHAVPYHAYDDAGPTLVTWGSLLRATWRFHDAYTDEVYALIDADWLKAGGLNPAGFDQEAMLADLALVAR